jgi:hypothetical protein
MRTVKYWLLAALAVSLVGVGIAEEKKEEKPQSTKAIMKKYHYAPKGEDPLCKKFGAGKLSDAEMKEIVAAYEDMIKNKPPKGDEESWKKKTTALLAAAKDVADKKEGAAEAFGKAVNCMACHSVHRVLAPRPPDKDK